MWEETWSVPGTERRPLWLEQSEQVGSIHSEEEGARSAWVL